MKRGFSLVELSIVLVILGLLTGGILAGQSLIRAAELRSVSTDYMRFETAYQTFRDKYFAVPGDMSTATSFWPTAVNGNGNGLITLGPEIIHAWNHLVFASLVEGGNYTDPGAGTTLIPGTNVPASRIRSAGFEIAEYATYNSRTGRALVFGTPRSGGAYQMSGGALTTSEAWSIDKKLDDGVANTGRMTGTGSNDGATCTGSAWNAVPGTDYVLTNTGVECYLKLYPS